MRILITGANRGIGAALVEGARERGHEVVTHGRSQGDITCDLAEVASIAEAFGAVEGPLDLLINNAGVIGPDRQDPLHMDWPGFAETMAVNAYAPLAVSQALLGNLRLATGRVLTVSSQMSWMGYRKADRIAYRASKSAVNKIMQGLATRLEPESIPVALVDPGWVKTDMGGAEAEDDPKEVAAGILDLGEKLGMADTGKFFHYTGCERAF